MELRKVLGLGWRLFTNPVSPLPLGIYRCAFGFLALANAALLAPDLFVWFGEHAIVSPQTSIQSTGNSRLDFFSWFGSTDRVTVAVFAAYVGSAFFTSLGLFTRLATTLLFITATSLHHRNIYILNSGDTICRLMGFFLMLAPSGAAFSLDRLWRVFRGRESSQAYRLISPTAFRLMQFQLCLVYFATGFWKATGGMWMDGTAVFVVNQIQQFERFPVPGLMKSLIFSKLMSWYTLAVELGAPFLLWFKETRIVMLGALLFLHAGLEYTMNIQLFQPIITSVFVLFLSEEEIRSGLRWLGRKLSARTQLAVTINYNGNSLNDLRWVHVVQCLDVFAFVSWNRVPGETASAREIIPSFMSSKAPLRRVLFRLPLAFPVGIFTLLPGASLLAKIVLPFIYTKRSQVSTGGQPSSGLVEPHHPDTKIAS